MTALWQQLPQSAAGTHLAKHKAIVTRITAIEELAEVTILQTIMPYSCFSADDDILAAYASHTENQDAIDARQHENELYRPLKIPKTAKKHDINIPENTLLMRADVHAQFDGYEFAFETTIDSRIQQPLMTATDNG
ncbi:hypothetical protein DFH09DRAFT_1308942 [Mycena vulgaris]|nr:hypothetical protein DFH09DRAFT_1308942 [Mycena vulgaris]